MMDVILSGAKNLRYVSQMLRLAAQHDNSSNNLRQSTRLDYGMLKTNRPARL
jgi:hypothetical protein